MANRAENIPEFRRGQQLKADDLNQLARAVPRRITGGDGVVVTAAGGSIGIRRQRLDRRPAADPIWVELGLPTGENPGEYEFTLYAGSGPRTGTCQEINEADGFPAGMRIMLRRAGGVWYFSGLGLEFRAKVIVVEDNWLYCQTLETSTAEGGGFAVQEGGISYKVWLPWDLQRQAWEGETIGGVSYTYDSAQKRAATGDAGLGAADETQIIADPYVAGSSIITVGLSANGPGPGALPGELIDKNVAGRSWLKEPE